MRQCSRGRSRRRRNAAQHCAGRQWRAGSREIRDNRSNRRPRPMPGAGPRDQLPGAGLSRRRMAAPRASRSSWTVSPADSSCQTTVRPAADLTNTCAGRADRLQAIALQHQRRAFFHGQAQHVHADARAPGEFVELCRIAQQAGKALQPAPFAVEMLLDDGTVEQPQSVCGHRRGRGPLVLAILVHGHDLGQGSHAGRRSPDHAAARHHLAESHLKSRLFRKCADKTIIQPRLQTTAEPHAGGRFQRADEVRGVGVGRIVGVQEFEAANMSAGCQPHPTAEAFVHDPQELLLVFVVAMAIAGRRHQDDPRLFAPGQFDESLENLVGELAAAMQQDRSRPTLFGSCRQPDGVVVGPRCSGQPGGPKHSPQRYPRAAAASDRPSMPEAKLPEGVL